MYRGRRVGKRVARVDTDMNIRRGGYVYRIGRRCLNTRDEETEREREKLIEKTRESYRSRPLYNFSIRTREKGRAIYKERREL